MKYPDRIEIRECWQSVHFGHSSVFIVNLKQILHTVLLFQLFTSNK